MKPFSWSALFLLPFLAMAECVPVRPTMQPTAVINITETAIPTKLVSLPSDTPSPTITLTPVETLGPAQVTETMQPSIDDPMNCAVPCFWGIVPGKTSFQEAKLFFSKLGFIPFEGTFEGRDFYTIEFDTGTGDDSSVTLHPNNNLVENIVVDPDIPNPIEGSSRKWIAYSPEKLIKQYGSPSHVEFTVSSYGMVGTPPNIGINMIMYFDATDLIVHYSGYNMTPESFCPLKAPFDFVRLWIGKNPPDTLIFRPHFI
jgi:hypothetical protein